MYLLHSPRAVLQCFFGVTAIYISFQDWVSHATSHGTGREEASSKNKDTAKSSQNSDKRVSIHSIADL